MPAENAAAALCVCGHERRHHFGDGPCLAAYKLPSGKIAEKTVCPCTRFEAK
jgi:hypothetical protein